MVLRSSVDQSFNREMGVLRAEKDEALRKANAWHHDESRKLDEKRAKARHDIWVEYDSQRNKLVLEHAGAESLEAVA